MLKERHFFLEMSNNQLSRSTAHHHSKVLEVAVNQCTQDHVSIHRRTQGRDMISHPTDESTQHIASSFVGGDDSLADQHRSRPTVIGDDTVGLGDGC